MATIGTDSRFVNVQDLTWEEAEAWLLKKGESGEVVPTTARLKAGALRLFAGVLREDEPKDCGYVLENLPELARRWTNLNQENKLDTARTYQGRARWALEVFLQYQADPMNFRFPDADRKPAEKKERKPKPEATVPAAVPLPSVGQPTRSFPVGDDRQITFSLPVGGINVREVLKFACHLMTLTIDFDPTEQSQAQMFALAKRPAD